MGRRLEEGFVVTDEPGIYFIPALIDELESKENIAQSSLTLISWMSTKTLEVSA